MRPYQLTAIAACREALAPPSGRAVIAMPPGTGAMHTAVGVVAEVGAHVSLVLVHRREQLHMTVRHLRDALPDAHVSVIDDATSPPLWTNVLIATVACARRLVADGHLRLDDLGFVVLHECHRSVGPLLADYHGRLLGLTDLPDPETLGRMGVSQPAFAYSFSDAVRDGYLVPFRLESRAMAAAVDVDLLVTSLLDADRLDAFEAIPDRRWFLTPHRARGVAHDLAERLSRDAAGFPHKAIVVVQDRSSAQMVVEILEEAFAVPGIAACITSSTTEAWAMSERFRTDTLPRLAVIVDRHESVSAPDVRAIVFLRPVRSRRLFYSLLCTGARPATDKTSLAVFDYVGAFDFHGEWLVE